MTIIEIQNKVSTKSSTFLAASKWDNSVFVVELLFLLSLLIDLQEKNFNSPPGDT